MTDTDLVGALRVDGNRAAVRFERNYATSAEDLWYAVTDPERLARWFAPVRGDLAIGGRYEIDFGHAVTTGTVLACEPPHLLELTWELPGEATAQLRVTFDDCLGQAHLVLDHTQLPVHQVGGYGAGWHAYLARLSGLLHGRELPGWDTLFAAHVEVYRSRVTART